MTTRNDTFHLPFISNLLKEKVSPCPECMHRRTTLKREVAICLDDDPLSLRLVEHLLKKRYLVMSCPTVESAIKVLDKHNVDLFLCDYHLGENFTGVQAFMQMRRDHGFNPEHNILITSYPSPEIEAETRAIGFHRVFAKPLRREFQSHCMNLRISRFGDPLAAS